MKNIGNIIRAHRGKQTLADVGKAIGISASTLSRAENGRGMNVVSFQKVCTYLGINPCEVFGIEHDTAIKPSRTRGFSVVALENPIRNVNIGSAMRAAFVYGASMGVIATDQEVSHKMMNSRTDSMSTYKHMPTLVVENVLDAVPYGCVPVGVEMVPESENLVYLEHPERAYYIFGPENGSISLETLSKCAAKVCVPTRYCMNLAATVNVVLYDRLSKKGMA